MGSDNIQNDASTENIGYGEVEAESNNIDSLEVVSSGGRTTRELESAAEHLTRVELDLACSCEKLVNLDILVMHVASRENDFEALALEEDGTLERSFVRALEFDLLYGLLDSEVGELDNFLCTLQAEIVSSRGFISSFKQPGDALKEIEEKLLDCEKYLKQSFEQVSDIKVQRDNFRRILLASSGDEKWKDGEEMVGLETGNISDLNAKIKMQTAEQQRNILKMLEKSLARELDLEKKLTESRQTEEESKLRLKQEIFCMEEEAEDLWEKLFQAENTVEVLLGVSRELSGRIQVVQLNINGSIHREGELRSKLQDVDEQLKEKSCALLDSQRSRSELVVKVNSLQKKLEEFESLVHDVKKSSEQNNYLKEKVIEAEKRAGSTEADCILLRESNMELNKELNSLKSSISVATARVEQLERQLKDSETKRLHAVAYADASQEKQNMLDCTIKDMENLIKDLKSKVSMAENQTESAEQKCIMLSESNAEFIEEINFLRRRTECLARSLHQADEVKKETVKDISVRTKLIADLVMQLALERERLHKEISSLTKEKKVAVMYLQQINQGRSVTMTGSRDAKEREPTRSKNDIEDGISGNRTNEEVFGSSATGYEVRNMPRDTVTTENKMGDADSTSKFNTVRNIDARQLSYVNVFLVICVVAIPVFVAFLSQQRGG